MQSFAYPLTAIVTLFALAVYFVITFNVARARVRHGVPAPQTTGPEEFMRCFRVHMNTLEQMAMFLPALWLAAATVHDGLAAGVGLFWPVGRIIYARCYYRDAARRMPGFIISIASSLALMLIALGGVVSVITNS